jgi:large subunit ribosomal protein L20
MTRVKRGIVVKKRHKKLLKKTRGYWGQRGNVFMRASETLKRAMAFAFKGRKLKKRDMRGLFIARIKAATTAQGVSYNRFISGLKAAKVDLNRKMLSQLAICEPQAFTQLISIAQK